MEKEHLIRLFKGLAEDEGQSPDFWPRLKPALLQRKNRRQGAILMKPVSRKNAWAYAMAAFCVLAIAAFTAFTPQGKVLAQSILNFFKPAAQEQVAIPLQPQALIAAEKNPTSASMVPIESLEQTTKSCNEMEFPRCPMEEVLEYLSFEPKLPEALPEGFKFGGAKAEANSLWVVYEHPGGSLYLFETLASEQAASFPVGVNAEIKPAYVLDQPAEYVEGYWQAGTSFDSLQWVADEFAQYLAWQDGELQYRLTSLGAKVPNSLRLGLEEMQAIAASVNSQEYAPVRAETSASPQELASKAGFEFIEPKQLPPGFVPGKTIVNPVWGAVCHFYEPLEGDGLPVILAEWHGNLPTVEQLTRKDPVFGHLIQTNISNLPVRGSDGEMGTLLDNGITGQNVCGEEAEFSNQVLIWKQGKRSHAIFFPRQDFRGRPYATQMEVVRMAEQINGLPVEADPVLDLDRLPSLQAASEAYGSPVAFPRQLFPGFHLQSFTVWKNAAAADRVAITSFVKKANYEFGGIWQLPADPDWEKHQEGCEQVEVWDVKAYLNSSCTADPLKGEQYCQSSLEWQTEDTNYSVVFNMLRPISPEEMLSFAESMRP
jgi:hypothetical protein